MYWNSPRFRVGIRDGFCRLWSYYYNYCGRTEHAFCMLSHESMGTEVTGYWRTEESDIGIGLLVYCR